MRLARNDMLIPTLGKHRLDTTGAMEWRPNYLKANKKQSRKQLRSANAAGYKSWAGRRRNDV